MPRGSAAFEAPTPDSHETVSPRAEPFLSRDEFKAVADALMYEGATDADLLANPELYGMSPEKMQKAIDMARLREEQEEARARVDESMVFTPEDLERVRQALQHHQGDRKEVEKAYKTLGMTKAQVRRALRVLDNPVTNRPANPRAPDVSPHVKTRRPRKAVEWTAEILPRLPEIKKDLARSRNAYPAYLEERFELTRSQAHTVMEELLRQGFLKRQEDGSLRLFPEGAFGASFPVVERVDPDELPGFGEKTHPRATPSWLAERNTTEAVRQLSEDVPAEDIPVETGTGVSEPTSGTHRSRKGWRAIAPALVRLQEMGFDPSITSGATEEVRENIAVDVPPPTRRQKTEAEQEERQKAKEALSAFHQQLSEERQQAEAASRRITATPGQPDIEATLPPVAERRPRRGRQLLKTAEDLVAEEEARSQGRQQTEERRRARLPVAPQIQEEKQTVHPPAPKPPSPWLTGKDVQMETPPLPNERQPAKNKDIPAPTNLPEDEDVPADSGVRERADHHDAVETPEARQKRLALIRAQLAELAKMDQYAPATSSLKAHRTELDAKRHKAEALLAREDLAQAVDEAQSSVDTVTGALEKLKEAIRQKEKEVEKQREIRAQIQEEVDEKKARKAALESVSDTAQSPAGAAELALLNNQIPGLERSLARQAQVVRALDGEVQKLMDQRKGIHRERREALARQDRAESDLHSIDAYLASAAVAALSLDATTRVSRTMAQEREQAARERAAAEEAARDTRTRRGLRAAGRGAVVSAHVGVGTLKGIGAVAAGIAGSAVWLLGKTVQFISNPLKALSQGWAVVKKFIEEAADGVGKTPKAKGT